ncbi:MFS transporter [Trueperella sp. LYQ143]|uniref:MFS transporter n=1 Tax=unclassified Trueperella TaxID=2630174 RepID=UPI003982FBC2
MTHSRTPADPHWVRHVTFLLASQGISLLGSGIVQFAILWHLTLTTKSGTIVALATASAFLPLVVLSPIAGVWADRYNRRVIAVCSDAFVALITLGIFLAFLTDHASLPLLIGALAARGAGGAMQRPAIHAMLPGFIPEEKLLRVNGIAGSVTSLTDILSPALGGAVLALWPIHSVFLIDIATAIIGIALFWIFVRVPSAMPEPKELNAWHTEMLSGLRYVRHHAFFLPYLMLMGLSIFAISAPGMLSSLYLVQKFNSDTSQLSIMETGFGVGALLGGIAVSLWPIFRRELSTIALATTTIGAITICLALAPNYGGFVIFIVLLGFTLPYINAPAITLFQRSCDRAHLGKVMSLVMIINGALMPLGAVVFGPVSDHISLETIMIISGLLQFISAFLTVSLPQLRRVSAPQHIAPPAASVH